MPDQYSITMPGAVYSGRGALRKIREITEGRFKKAALFTDQGVEQAGLLKIPLEILNEAGVETVVITDLPAEPNCDGSLTVRQLLEDPGLGRKCVPTLMIPTTAGTGSEATMNSIVAVPEKQLKVGIVNPEMIPDYVILDGSLLKNLPRKIAAATGVDAMAHAVECFTSNKANPFSNLFAKAAAKLIFDNIEAACDDPEAEEAKTNMLIAAFYAGAAISSSGTTAVHALSYPLGGKYHIPHGVSNAMLLLPVMRFNKPACLKELAELYDTVVGKELQITDEEKADRLLERMEEIIRRLEIPSSLSAFGIGTDALEELVNAGMDVKRLLNNNKREITHEDARRLYLEVMHG